MKPLTLCVWRVPLHYHLFFSLTLHCYVLQVQSTIFVSVVQQQISEPCIALMEIYCSMLIPSGKVPTGMKRPFHISFISGKSKSTIDQLERRKRAFGFNRQLGGTNQSVE